MLFTKGYSPNKHEQIASFNPKYNSIYYEKQERNTLSMWLKKKLPLLLTIYPKG